MPQENQVVRCYSCLAFQVHLVKKQKKWQCKMCNSKQSLKQVYGKGSGKDCRLHAMKLNELQFSGNPVNDCITNDVNEHVVQDNNPTFETLTMNDIKNESKWSQYMNKIDETSDEEEEISYKTMENECSDKKKRKLNSDFAYSSSEMCSELFSKHEYKINVETETVNMKHEEKFTKCGMTFYDGTSIETGSKWSVFIDTEQCLSDEECKDETEAVFKNKIESSQNLPDQKSVNMEKLDDGDRGTCLTYSKYLVNTHFEDKPLLGENKKYMKGNLKILKTLHDDDDLDEILNI